MFTLPWTRRPASMCKKLFSPPFASCTTSHCYLYVYAFLIAQGQRHRYISKLGMANCSDQPPTYRYTCVCICPFFTCVHVALLFQFLSASLSPDLECSLLSQLEISLVTSRPPRALRTLVERLADHLDLEHLKKISAVCMSDSERVD